MKKDDAALRSKLTHKLLRLHKLETYRVPDIELVFVLGGDPPDDPTGSGPTGCASETTTTLRPPI